MDSLQRNNMANFQVFESDAAERTRAVLHSAYVSRSSHISGKALLSKVTDAWIKNKYSATVSCWFKANQIYKWHSNSVTLQCSFIALSSLRAPFNPFDQCLESSLNKNWDYVKSYIMIIPAGETDSIQSVSWRSSLEFHVTDSESLTTGLDCTCMHHHQLCN